MRTMALIVLAFGCGPSGGDPGTSADASAPDGADAFTGSDASAPDGTDAFTRSDGLTGCGCAPFEVCTDGACECGRDPLCGTAGFATFPIVAPGERLLSARGEVVVDRITGLRWERSMDGSSRTHAEARERCANLELDGHDDWRVPARVELATILDASRTPTLDVAVFGAAIEDYVWTASVAANDPARAYAIYFGQGETILAAADLSGGHVRCVRGPRNAARERRLEGGWLVDEGAELEWSVATEPAAPLAEARLACERRGARVPTLYELHSLVDEGREPAIDPRLEGAELAVWSVTERDFGEVLAWVMDFREGTSELRSLDEPLAARCVRTAVR